MAKYAYIGENINISGIGTTDLGGLELLGTSRFYRAQIYEVSVTFPQGSLSFAGRAILRRGTKPATTVSGSISPLEDGADPPSFADPIKASNYGGFVENVLDYPINNVATFTWVAQDEDQRIVYTPDPDVKVKTAITAGYIATLSQSNLYGITDIKFEST